MPKTEDVVAEAANEIAAENEERKEGGEQQQEQKEQEQQQQEQKDGQEQQQQQEPEQQPEAGVMPKAEEQVQDNAQVEEERKEEGQDLPVVYLSQVPIKEKEVKSQQYAQEHQAQEANVGVDEQKEEGQLKIPRILADNVKLIDGDGREYMQPKAHELWNNGKTLFVYPQTEAQKQKPIPDATDLHAFVITLDKRLDLGSADSDTDTTMWERTQERLKEIPLIHAEKSPGVDPKAWPQSGLQEALYATGFARLFWNIHQNDPLYADLPPERRTVAELPWIGEVEKRDQNGYFRAQSQGLSHHYGCLYAHLYQWQKIKDTGLKKALILESDGLSLTRVPLESIPSVAKQMPGDADFVTLQLYPYEPAGVERRNVEIKHPTSGEHKTYSFDKLNYHPQQGYAGLASYIATDTFVEKIQHFLALHGADMIDGYILNKLCTTSYNNEEAKNIAWTMYDMQKYTHPFDPQNPTPTILNCYKALADPEYYHDLNIRMEAEARAD
jgi:GR25 family glycosyltransferase involved in LPS biosynthesis